MISKIKEFYIWMQEIHQYKPSIQAPGFPGINLWLFVFLVAIQIPEV